jgi:hypothetical protein
MYAHALKKQNYVVTLQRNSTELNDPKGSIFQ